MSCRRAFDLDLAAYLVEPRREEFAGFRGHYPRCPDCAAEVRTWTELQARLGGGAAPAHPAPRRLLDFEAERLPAEERLRVSAHLERCVSCRDELAALRGFDPASSRAPSAAAPAGPLRALAGLLDALRRVLWHPAFAYAVALVVTAPALYLWTAPAEPPLVPGSARVEKQEAPARAPVAGEAVLGDEGSAEAPRAQERSPAPALQKRDVPARGLVSGGAPSAGAPAPPTPAWRARASAEEAEPPREPLPRPEALRPAERSFAGDAEVDAAAVAPLRALGHAQAAAPELPEGRAPAALLEDLGGGVFALRVPVDPAAREVEIRLVSPDGQRELVERFAGGALQVELRVPAGWLEPGTQRVERHMAGRTQVFSVEVP